MVVLGYLSAAFGLYLLYDGLIFIGALSMFVGGLMSGGFTIGLSSISTLSLISLIAYGIHNEFTIIIVILCLVFAVLAASSKGCGHWEFEFRSADSSSGSGGGGDGGGD